MTPISAPPLLIPPQSLVLPLPRSQLLLLLHLLPSSSWQPMFLLPQGALLSTKRTPLSPLGLGLVHPPTILCACDKHPVSVHPLPSPCPCPTAKALVVITLTARAYTSSDPPVPGTASDPAGFHSSNPDNPEGHLLPAPSPDGNTYVLPTLVNNPFDWREHPISLLLSSSMEPPPELLSISGRGPVVLGGTTNEFRSPKRFRGVLGRVCGQDRPVEGPLLLKATW